MGDWLTLHVAALLLVAALFGGMLMFAALFAPLIFRKLPADTAAGFIREVFPVYYRVLGILALVAALPLVPAQAYMAEISMLVTIALGSVVYFGCRRFALESVFATLAVGFVLRTRIGRFEVDVRQRLRGVWQVAEVILFANLGSQIEVQRLNDYRQVLLLTSMAALALAVRLGVAALLARRTPLTAGERRYLTASHVPKATIQAVFGALPLVTFMQRGQAELVADGHKILILAVIAIVGTAPIGAVLLERWAARDLKLLVRR